MFSKVSEAQAPPITSGNTMKEEMFITNDLRFSSLDLPHSCAPRPSSRCLLSDLKYSEPWWFLYPSIASWEDMSPGSSPREFCPLVVKRKALSLAKKDFRYQGGSQWQDEGRVQT